MQVFPFTKCENDGEEFFGRCDAPPRALRADLERNDLRVENLVCDDEPRSADCKKSVGYG